MKKKVIELIETEELDGNWYKIMIDGLNAKCFNKKDTSYETAKAIYDKIVESNGTIFSSNTLHKSN